jgi:hypothetical protein
MPPIFCNNLVYVHLLTRDSKERLRIAIKVLDDPTNLAATSVDVHLNWTAEGTPKLKRTFSSSHFLSTFKDVQCEWTPL